MKKFTSILLVIAAVFMSFQVQAQEQTGAAIKTMKQFTSRQCKFHLILVATLPYFKKSQRT